MKKDGSINLKFIKSSINALSKKLIKSKTKPIIIIKSTVVPNTSEHFIRPLLKLNGLKESKHFEILSNPEFLREGLRFTFESTRIRASFNSEDILFPF